jgi:hypothetical protein
MRLVIARSLALASSMAFLLLAFSGLAGGSASAASDLSGSWNASYSLACNALVTQSGGDVSARLDCGSNIVVDLSGTFDTMTRRLALSGEFATNPVDVQATLSGDGRSLEGSWSAPPLVTEGAFQGLREGDPMDSSSLTGNWNLSILNIFSSSCRADVEQDGASVSAYIACVDGPSGTLVGTADPDTGNVSLSGPFGTFGALEMRISVSEDGGSFNGVWVITGVGPGGTTEGTRLEAPTPTRSRPRATPTAAISLPETGGGPAGGTPHTWVYAAIAGGFALSAASFAALRRARS